MAEWKLWGWVKVVGLSENGGVELYLSPLNLSLPWACRYSMNIPASISVWPTFKSRFHHLIELTLCARWPPNLFYFEGLAKLGTSWITALYSTSPKEIFLEKNRCRRLKSILMMRGAPCHERQQLCAKSLLWAGLLVAGLGSEPYPDWGRRYIPG